MMQVNSQDGNQSYQNYQNDQNVQIQYSQGKKKGRQQSGVQNDRQIGARGKSGCGAGRRTFKLLGIAAKHGHRSFLLKYL